MGQFTNAKSTYAGVDTLEGPSSHSYTQTLTASLTMAGSTLVKGITYLISAAITMSGSLHKLTTRSLTALINYTTVLTKRLLRIIAGSSFGSTSTLSRNDIKALAAAIAITGTLSRIGSKVLAANINLSGIINRKVNKPITATFSMGTTLLKYTANSLAATLTFVTSFTNIKAFQRFLTAVFNPTAVFTTTESFVQVLASSLLFTTNQVKKINRVLIANLVLINNLFSQTVKLLTAVLSSSANLGRFTQKYITATLSNVGILFGRFLAFENAKFGIPIQAVAVGISNFVYLYGKVKNTMGSIAGRAHKQSYMQSSNAIKVKIEANLEVEQTYHFLGDTQTGWGFDIGEQPLPPEAIRELVLAGIINTHPSIQVYSRIFGTLNGSVDNSTIWKTTLDVKGSPVPSDITFMV